MTAATQQRVLNKEELLLERYPNVSWSLLRREKSSQHTLSAMCPMPLYLSLFSTMSSFVYLYSLYVHMFKLYLSVFVRLLSVFNVNCMHQGSESYAISILCMYVLYMWQN